MSKPPIDDDSLARGAAPPGVEVVAASPPAAAVLSLRATARTVGVDEKTVRRMVDRGELKPVPGAGPKRFAFEDVQRVTFERRTRTTIDGELERSAPGEGELASELFAAFQRGETPVALVQSRCLAPGAVERLHAQYQRMVGSYVVDEAQAREISSIRGRVILDAKELLQSLSEGPPIRECGMCKYRFEDGEFPVCGPCAYGLTVKEAEILAEKVIRERRERAEAKETGRLVREHNRRLAKMTSQIR